MGLELYLLLVMFRVQGRHVLLKNHVCPFLCNLPNDTGSLFLVSACEFVWKLYGLWLPEICNQLFEVNK